MSEIVWEQGRIDTTTGNVSYDDKTAIITELTDIPLGSYQFILPYVSVIFKKVSNGTTTDVSYSNIRRYIFLYDENNSYLGNQQITYETYGFEESKFANARKFRFECYYNTSYNMYPSQPQVVTETTYYYMELCSFYFNTVRFHEVNNTWISVNAAPVEHEVIELPLPLSYWRIDSTHNDGYPWHERLGDIPYAPPAPIYAIKPQKQIQVYEYTTSQENLLSKNGVAILFPESCTSRHELNGRWDITLTHKIDKLGKWEYLKFENILKIGGQLFRIDTQQTQVDYDKELITVHANHIFYDWNQRLVEKDVFTLDESGDPIDVAPITFWELIDERSKPLTYQEYDNYIFTRVLASVYSDGYHTDYPDQPATDIFNQTATDLMIGSNSFISRWRGEIYRDNFYYSMYPTIENCMEDSFYLRFSVEIKSLNYAVDENNLATEIALYDKNKNYSHGAWYIADKLNHARPYMVQVDYPATEEVKEIIWQQKNHVNVDIDVEINELKYNPKYKDKKATVPRYHVGDKGYIIIQGQKEPYRITAVERDEITKDFISITFKKID